MFVIIRLIISILIAFLINCILKKICYIGKGRLFKTLLNIIIVSSLLIALSFCPLENLVVTFDTPKQVFEYVNPNVQKISLVVPGNKSDLVIAEHSSSYIYLIVPKDNYGSKIGVPSSTKMITKKIHNNIIIYVYQYANTEDFYITISNIDGGYISVSDIYDSKFYLLEKENKSLNKTFVTYFGFIHNCDSNYSVMIDGDVIKIINN